MSNEKSISSWREDLDHARDVSKREAETIGFAVNWFESWRLTKDLEATSAPNSLKLWMSPCQFLR